MTINVDESVFKNKKESKRFLIGEQSFDSPSVSLEYLRYSNKDFDYLLKLNRKKQELIKEYLKDLEIFINEFSMCPNYSEAKKRYSSHKSGRTIPLSKTGLSDSLNNLPDEIMSFIVTQELVHFHLKRQGKEQGLVIGFGYENIFYILAFDPLHELI